ncbi:hypothetical protein LINGRAHAP2_LOCUS5065, partial [Linum grandiflorum]
MDHGITPAKLRKLSCGSQPSSVASGSSSSSPSINLSLDAYQRLTEDLTEKITQKVTEEVTGTFEQRVRDIEAQLQAQFSEMEMTRSPQTRVASDHNSAYYIN